SCWPPGHYSFSALDAMNHPVCLTRPTLTERDGNIINIPWDMKDVAKESSKEAKQEGATLKKALDNPKAPGSREDIAAIAQSLSLFQPHSELVR
ncbi:hypothetical protein ABZ723_34480, partial [Streptomyces sp. NPDC006700]|uniref:hypothetical protein n=1 Tax=Streptomyces sp. NPDC006700 TaxID=3154479 RepID=UPI0033E467E8